MLTLKLQQPSEIQRARSAKKLCTVHSRDSFSVHEQSRLLSAWYFLKLYVLSYHTPDDGLRKQLDEELKNFDIAQLYVYLTIVIRICKSTEHMATERLSIRSPDPDLPDARLVWQVLDDDWENCWVNLLIEYGRRNRTHAHKAHYVAKAVHMFLNRCEVEDSCNPRA